MKRTLSVTWLVLICFLISNLSTPLAAAVRDADTPTSRSTPFAAQISSPTSADEARLQQFELSLDYLRQQYKIPGLSAAIVNNGQLIWERGFGFQDVGNRIPATPETPYRIPSLTKTFASMLVMKCVEQGTLNLDTPISNYTAAIPERSATVRHVFTHTSENPPGANYHYSGNRYAGNVVGSRFANLFLQMLDDPEAFKGNPIDGERFFVRQQYLDFLGREPDPAGLDYWSENLAQCANDTACIHSRRIGVSAAFFVEQEFQEPGNFIYRLYKSSLGRRPTFNEFMPDRNQLIGGSQLESSKQVFADQWVQRAEFAQKYPASLNSDQFIEALIQTVFQTGGVDISSQRATLVNDYEANGSRARIVRLVADNSSRRNTTKAFVLMQYFGYLRRNPDESGYQFWLDVLNNRVPGNFRGMVCAFLTSAEYQLRFGSMITRTDRDCAQ